MPKKLIKMLTAKLDILNQERKGLKEQIKQPFWAISRTNRIKSLGLRKLNWDKLFQTIIPYSLALHSQLLNLFSRVDKK